MEIISKYLNRLANFIKIKSKSIINRTYAIFVLLTPTHQVTIQKIGKEYVILVKQLNLSEDLSLLDTNKKSPSSAEKNNDNPQKSDVLTLECKTTYKMINNNTNEDNN